LFFGSGFGFGVGNQGKAFQAIAPKSKNASVIDFKAQGWQIILGVLWPQKGISAPKTS